MFELIMRLLWAKEYTDNLGATKPCKTCKWYAPADYPDIERQVDFSRCGSPRNMQRDTILVVKNRIDPDAFPEIMAKKYKYCTTQRDGDGAGSCGSSGSWWEEKEQADG